MSLAGSASDGDRDALLLSTADVPLVVTEAHGTVGFSSGGATAESSTEGEGDGAGYESGVTDGRSGMSTSGGDEPAVAAPIYNTRPQRSPSLDDQIAQVRRPQPTGWFERGSPRCVWASIGVAVLVLTIVALSVMLASPSGRACMQQPLARQAKAVLTANWAGTKTLPSPNLYPHQWSWDSAFISMAYAWYDIDRGMLELTSLFDGQWTTGLLPHIVFNPDVPVGSYWPGPPFWNCSALNSAAPSSPATSGIVQPAVHATAVRRIMERAQESGSNVVLDAATAWLARIYPKVVAWHDYLYRERDPDGNGLVYIRHPWESGMDNSPNWFRALDRIHIAPGDIPPADNPLTHRADTHRPGVNPADRPSNATYERYAYLVVCARRYRYDEALIRAHCPFRVDDVLFNSILARAESDLSALAAMQGLSEDARRFEARFAKTADAIRTTMWSAEHGIFLDYDEEVAQVVPERVAGGFTPVWAGVVTPETEMADPLLHTLNSAAFCGTTAAACSFAVPTYDATAANFSTHNYWQGPVWINLNYLIRAGIEMHLPVAGAVVREHVLESTLHLVARTGFREYFSPVDGSGHGADSFSWTAALYIDTVCSADSEWAQ